METQAQMQLEASLQRDHDLQTMDALRFALANVRGSKTFPQGDSYMLQIEFSNWQDRDVVMRILTDMWK